MSDEKQEVRQWMPIVQKYCCAVSECRCEHLAVHLTKAYGGALPLQFFKVKAEGLERELDQLSRQCERLQQELMEREIELDSQKALVDWLQNRGEGDGEA